MTDFSVPETVVFGTSPGHQDAKARLLQEVQAAEGLEAGC